MRWLHWTVEQFETTKNPANCQFCELRLGGTGHFELIAPFPTRRKDQPPLPLKSIPHPMPGDSLHARNIPYL